MRVLLALGAFAWTSLAVAGRIDPAAVAAPALGELGLIALAVVVGVAGAVVVRRKK